jgi:uncharacterized protein
MTNARKFSRRDFLNLLKAGAFRMALLAAGGAGVGVLLQPGEVKIETVRLNLRRLSSAFTGIRLVQISDIHMGGWMNADRLQHVANLVISQKPEAVLITGDFLVGHGFDATAQRSIQDLIDVLSPLAAAIPSFAILGNHDYWTNAKAVREMLRLSQISELTNTVATLRRGTKKLHLCGLDDIWEGKVRLDEVLVQLPEDGCAILMAHEPDFADISAKTGRFDLQISGHSHGGQVVIPFYGPPVLPHLGEKYPIGLYKVGDMYQYTNRGVGVARLPIRINCPPEITLFILEGNEKI